MVLVMNRMKRTVRIREHKKDTIRMDGVLFVLALPILSVLLRSGIKG